MFRKLTRRPALRWSLPLLAIALGLLWGRSQGPLEARPQVPKVPKVKSVQLPDPSGGPRAPKAITIYMARGPEKVKAARNMNILHDEMAGRGFAFSDFEPHYENNDLEGWWITYLATAAR